MDTNLVLLIIAGVAIVLVPLLNWWQNRSIAKRANAKAEEATALLAAKAEEAKRVTVVQDEKLDHILLCVNSRLTTALQTIEDLKSLLLLALSSSISPEDPRIKSVIEKLN